MKRREPQKLIIIDECHRSLASYIDIMERWPNAFVVGLTATPQRTTGEGLGDVRGAPNEGPNNTDHLSKEGWLCDYELFAPPQLVPTLAQIKETAGITTSQRLKKQ